MMEQLEFLQYNATIERKAREQRTLSGEMGQIKRRAKEAGVDLEARAVVAKLAKRDMMERVVFFNAIVDQAEALRLFGVGEISRLQAPDLTADISDEAYYADGWSACNMAMGRDSFAGDPRSQAGVQWNRGYDEALKSLDLDAEPASEPDEPAEPKRRSRRKAKTDDIDKEPEPAEINIEAEPVEAEPIDAPEVEAPVDQAEAPLDPADVRHDIPPEVAKVADIRPGDGNIAAKLIAQRAARRLAGKYP